MTSRLTAAAGVVFAICLAVPMALIDTPDTNKSAAVFHAYFADSGHRAELIAGGAVVGVAGLAWLLFALGLRERATSDLAGRIGVALAGVSAALLCAGGAMFAAIPLTMIEHGTPQPAADLERVLPDMGYVCITVFGMPAAALSLLAFLSGTADRVLMPRPLAITGAIVAVLAIVSFFWMPMFLLALWVLAAAAVLARRPLHVPA